jgi:para-aminobenzoate synthetase component 1
MIETLSNKEARLRMNDYGKKSIPYLFVIDFDMEKPIVVRLDQIDPYLLKFSFHGITRNTISGSGSKDAFKTAPVDFSEYQKAYDLVQQNIQAGNTYLTNLTFPTSVTMPWTLPEIYHMANARYKLWIKDKFVVFSPEPFVKIANGQISTFPMKGTIDASIPGAREILAADLKEKAEHATIVDLLRNDLNLVSERVGVERYRYFEKVHTGAGDLYQTSSHIRGFLPSDYQQQLGDILFELLPAGSVTGAPKKKTVEIIKAAEPYDRGYYTGIFGIFDGRKLESAVSIRFIEQQGNRLVYKSGGGITSFSNMEAEYRELLDKVYLPVANTIGYEQRVVAIGNH